MMNHSDKKTILCHIAVQTVASNMYMRYELHGYKTYNVTFMQIDDSDQPVHPPSLIGVNNV